MLVLDVSGSMSSTSMPSGLTRWVEALNAFDAVLPATNASLNWGLLMYPGAASSNGTYVCALGSGVDVPVAPMNAASVQAAYHARKLEIMNATPTTAAVNAASSYLRSRTTPNPKYIVLATDGDPNCATLNDNSITAQTRADAVAAVTESKAAGVPVFVVGISTSDTAGSTTLDLMAEAGGRPVTGSLKYYSANSQAELATAMSQISGSMMTCQFTSLNAPPDPDSVAVQFNDGTLAKRDPTQTNGWDYTDNTHKRISLFGPSCDAVMNGVYTDVKILFGCPGQSIL
jgi:hypothetical protein